MCPPRQRGQRVARGGGSSAAPCGGLRAHRPALQPRARLQAHVRRLELREGAKDRLGSGESDHRRAMLRNLAAGLFEHGQITTTLPKAKALRPYAEKLVTKAKKGGVHRQRIVVATIHDQTVTSRLFNDIAPRYADRNGGYTRITKLGPRPGDNAPMARIELV